MPSPITIIIPTLNAAKTIGPCLGAIALGLHHGAIAQVIFADGGSSDDIAKIAELSGATLTLSPKGRGSQLAYAAPSARSDWLLFLHSDTVLAENWPQTALSHIANNPEYAGYFQLRFDANTLPAKIVAHWANWRARVFGLPYGDQGLLISKDLYTRIGGYADIPLMEDVHMAKALKSRLLALDCTATTSAARYQKQGWIRQSLANFILLMRYKMGADPEALAKKYRS